MEIRDFALRVVESEELDAKLTAPKLELSDQRPGPAYRAEGPGRPTALRIRPNREVKVPALSGMVDPAQRARILHALANHELQATELFAWALLAFPDAPAEYRRGLLKILQDEQRHTRMYIARVEATGHRFGDFPVTGYFWSKAEHLTTPLRFVCAMSLTFENANLDHTVDFAEAARAAGDSKTATVIEQVHRDEAEHVKFGWTWLQRLKEPNQSAWDAYQANLTWPLRPLKAKGSTFHTSGRELAGLDANFIRRLEAVQE